MDTQDLSIAEMGRLLRAGNVTSETLARDALARVAARDAALHAFVLVTEDRALARRPPRRHELKSGKDRGPFHGIPYALKDIYDTAGIRTTCHSKLRLNVVPKEDSVAAARLRRQVAFCLASSPRMNSPSAARASTCHFRRRAILGTPTTSPAVRHPVPARRSARAWCAWRWARTLAARSAARRPGAALSASSRPMAVSRGAACSRCHGRSTIRPAGPQRRGCRDNACRCSPATTRRTPPAPTFRSPIIAPISRRACQVCVSASRARSLQRRQGHDARGRRCIDRTARSVARCGRRRRGHRAPGLHTVRRGRPGHHDGRGFRDPRSRHADASAGLW